MRAVTRFWLFICLFVGGFPRPLFPQVIDQRESFAKAYALYSAGKLSEAQALFRQTQDARYVLADYALYFSALIAFNQKNWDSSRQFLSTLKQQYPQSIWLPDAELLRAKMDLAQKRYSEGIGTLTSLRVIKGIKTETAEESLYLQGQAKEAQGEVNQAYALYQAVRVSYPYSRWTSEARKDQARLKEKYPELLGLTTIKDTADEAEQLTREGKYRDAELLYKELLNNVTEPELRMSFTAKLAGVYLAERKRNEAIPVLEQIARDYPETSEAPKALYQIGQILWNRHDNAQALAYFKLIMERYPTSSYVERARYAAGDIYEAGGRMEEAVRLYSSLSTEFPNSPVRDDATWRLAWLYYRTGDWQSAATTFKILAGQASDGSYRTAALYWQARSTEKLADKESAIQLFRQLVTAGDESYYQTLALQRLALLGVPFPEPSTTITSIPAEIDPPMTPENTFHLAHARELSALRLHRLAVDELDRIDYQSGKQTGLRRLLVREYFQNEAYGRSLALANQLPASDVDRNLYRFPLAYWEIIRKKAQEREIDPYLVLALIRQESLFDSRARSPAFALGLMQILPSTAARVARRIGITPPSNEKLFEPEANLTLGTQYLKDLLRRYSNNWFKAIAAYNAGEAAVDRWEKEIGTEDIEEFVERIPYVETRGYVKLVTRNHRIYKKLYEPRK